MADLSDVTAYLAQAAAAAIYPNGATQPSIAGMDVRIFEGWPIPEQLDLDVAGKMKDPAGGKKPIDRPGGPCASVSVLPLPGVTAVTYQLLNKTHVLQEPTIGITAVLAGTTLTLSGVPQDGEIVTLVCDRQHVFSGLGTTAAAILADLLSQAQQVYPGASLSGSVLTVPYQFACELRQGGIGLLGRVTHRQRHAVNVSVWAPSHTARATIASAIDAALKAKNVVTMPDGSDALIVFARTLQTDESQNVTVYRRDLVFDCEYATLETFAGTSITSASLQTANAADQSIVKSFST